MSTLCFTLIQSTLAWEDKAANLKMFEEKIFSLTEKTEIVILPEMFSTGFSMQPRLFAERMDGETVNWMKRISAAKKIILTGSVIIEEEGNYYNRLIWMLPNGTFGTYDKRHLFAYAEEDQHYTRGNRRLIASVKGWKIHLQVCYDLRFPVWSRQQSQEEGLEYDVLIYIANWPERRSTAWKALLQARAIENQCYTIGVNRVGNDGHAVYHSGDSMVIDMLGDVLYHAPDDEAIHTFTLIKTDLDKTREKFPFWKDGDHFAIMP
ncbi:MAG: amidohydrolase [Chitinophagaceae bacterium]|nr:amidohydrolase [Chitinophagaceae bacterium]